MLTVGLTGGIGAGKSSVTTLLAARGAAVVDADLMARKVVAPGTDGLRAVLATFGAQMQLPDGTLDRARLASLVFADPVALARLNAIVHPLVGQLTAAAFDQARADGVRVLVHDVALLVENGLAPAYDVVVVVDADPAVQLRRLTEQRGMSLDEATARMGRQATRAQRLAVADEVVSNEGSRDDLALAVERLWERLLARLE